MLCCLVLAAMDLVGGLVGIPFIGIAVEYLLVYPLILIAEGGIGCGMG